MGYAMQATGGVFHFNLTSALQLKSIVMQKPQMIKYASSYGDFVLCDGTHNVSMYVLKLMPFTVVDCLGRNVLCGVALDESENSESVKLGLELCQLHAAGSTLMTDGGSAYPGVASDLGMVHILCTKHFEDVILKGCTGLGALAKSFKADCTSLLYTTMSEVEFQTRFDVAEAKYGVAKEPAKALLSISRHKEKVCRAFTGSVFTCSSLATQRGESMNSVIKENGFKKKELRRFNLLQLAEHLWSIFQRQEIKACDELVTLLVAKRRWSNYVDGLWRANVLKAETLPHVTEVGGIWYVSGSHFDDVADAAHRIQDSMCRNLSENAVASTPHTYRLFMANLSTWVDGFRQSGYSGGLEPFTMPQYTSPPELIDVVDETRQAAANAVRGVAPPQKSSEKSKSCANKSVLSYRTGHPRKRKRTVSAPSSATQEARPPSESSVSSRGRLQRAKQFDNFVV
ncbi:hypothetical protein H257_18793 [Aphanomyces astaci]|uniref:ZSWIM1/3 RNaseH-like domain-containing protein n=1 Tax=Aphanomyces astaci TaxID=112090 RepID=W4FBW1_APHAT|nr:hypothetical protein H257_18793 [Aphanomyces astaci]ETV64301.1 hypothetical protein H257_18793 [Aphanomyces astaci]|eukprot:XP_009846218.1 hypothetical protein H257_18793 [Aphanomyces astaci]